MSAIQQAPGTAPCSDPVQSDSALKLGRWRQELLQHLVSMLPRSLVHAPDAELPGLCRTEGGPPYTKEALQAVIDAELALASSAGAEPAGAAAGEDVGPESQAPAAPDSPGSQSARAAGAAAGAARLSLEGRLSLSDAYTGRADAGSSPPVAASAPNPAAERSTAHGAPLDSGVWDAADGIGSGVQTSSAQIAQSEPCSVTAAGTAAVGSSAGQLPSRKAGRQPTETGSTHREVPSSAKAAHAEKPQAAHDGQGPDVAQVCSHGPPIPSYMPIFHG